MFRVAQCVLHVSVAFSCFMLCFTSLVSFSRVLCCVQRVLYCVVHFMSCFDLEMCLTFVGNRTNLAIFILP